MQPSCLGSVVRLSSGEMVPWTLGCPQGAERGQDRGLSQPLPLGDSCAVHRLQGSVTRLQVCLHAWGGPARPCPGQGALCSAGSAGLQRGPEHLPVPGHRLPPNASFRTTWGALGTKRKTMSLSVSIYCRPPRQSAHHSFYFSNSPAVFSVPSSLRMLICLVFSSLYFSLQLLRNVCQ